MGHEVFEAGHLIHASYEVAHHAGGGFASPGDAYNAAVASLRALRTAISYVV